MRKTSTIQLKNEFPTGREITVGTSTIKFEPGKPVRIPIRETDAFLRTGKVELVDDGPEETEELSPVDHLMKDHNKEGLLEKARALGVEDTEVKSLNKRELAELIVKKSEER